MNRQNRKIIYIQLQLFYLFVLKCSSQSSGELIISTAWQAENAGISVGNHYQCKAWHVYWRTQTRNTDLSIADIELLAQRRRSVSIYSMHDAYRNDIPTQLLQTFSAVHINFEAVCRLHPRVLWFNTTADTYRYGLNLNDFCEMLVGNETTGGQLDTISSKTPKDIRRSLVNVERYDSESETNYTQKFLFLRSSADFELLPASFRLNSRLLDLHESIGIAIDALCGSVSRPSADEEFVADDEDQEFFNSLAFEVTGLGMNASQVRQFIEQDDSSLDDIMLRFSNISEERPFPATQITPWLKNVKYDQRTPPSLLPGHTVVVKMGLFVQSVSNFELTTMDYDMDVWIRMAWRDIRLKHSLSKPILINEFTSLRRIWRPDPFVTNAKDAKFHRVTYLNFYLFVFPNGDVFMEMRTMLKNSCQLVFCKYPHDEQKCGMRLSSIGFTQDVVRFEWFSRKWDAIRMKENMQIPELFLLDHTTTECNGKRKSGNYTCVEASFMMKREIGYYVAQTYIPTTICVVFSWVGAWLPEEFVEGRILVSLTVFLTLSAENNAAKEDLPKVSYIKAIDLWFGFTSTFVFATMIQALIIISLENQSKNMKKKAMENEEQFGKYVLIKMLLKSRRLHKVARDFDTFCKVMYPVIFLLFLMIYRFVIIEGEDTKCLREEQA